MSFKWTNDLTIQLIELYKGFECLWNPVSVKYKCRNAKHDAWAQICEVTGANETEVKRKIKNMITQFYRERKKYRLLKKSGAGASFISRWFAYNYMLFLTDKNQPRQCTEKGLNETQDYSNISNIDVEDEDFESEDFILADNFDDENISQVEDPDHTQDITEVNQIQYNETLPEPSIIKTQLEFSSKKFHPEDSAKQSSSGLLLEGTSKKNTKKSIGFNNTKKSVKRKHKDISIDERQEEAYMVLKELQNKKPRDRFDVFGEHVAFKIRSLHTEQAQNSAEHLISNILWEASIGKFDQSVQFQTMQSPMFLPSSTYTSRSSESPSYTLSPSPCQTELILTTNSSMSQDVSNKKNSNNEQNVPPLAETQTQVIYI